MYIQVAMDRERGERASLESQLRDAKREAAELQARYDAHSAELNARYAYGVKKPIIVWSSPSLSYFSMHC